MVAVDTNVTVRLITGDDPAQLEQAVRLVEQTGIWISSTVVLETAWVLKHHYQATALDIVHSIRTLSATDGIEFEAEQNLIEALELAEEGADIADAIHLAFASDEHLPFHTFDQDFHRKASQKGHAINLIS